MSVIQLSLAESPIRGYMMYSYHLAVTFSHIDAWPWFFSNYIQLQCNPAQLELADFLDFSTMPKGEIHFTEGTSPYNPWLSDSNQLDEIGLKAHTKSISRYVVEGIKNGFYVETFIDEFYIPALFNGGRLHFRHRLLVFGYDEATSKFYIVGFDKNSQYKKLECTYDELNSAFQGICPQIPDRTRLFNPTAKKSLVVPFDNGRFVGVLNEYLSSSNTLLNPDLRGDLKKETVLWYGLKTYDFLQEYLLKSIERKASGGLTGLDFRGFHMAWEHKKCMLNRLRWMTAAGYNIPDSLLAQYARVVSLNESACSRVVMCRRGLLPIGKGHLNEVPNLLENSKKIEMDVLSEVSDIVTQAQGK